MGFLCVLLNCTKCRRGTVSGCGLWKWGKGRRRLAFPLASPESQASVLATESVRSDGQSCSFVLQCSSMPLKATPNSHCSVNLEPYIPTLCLEMKTSQTWWWVEHSVGGGSMVLYKFHPPSRVSQYRFYSDHTKFSSPANRQAKQTHGFANRRMPESLRRSQSLDSVWSFLIVQGIESGSDNC